MHHQHVRSQISEHKQMPGRGTWWGNFKTGEFVNRFTPIPPPPCLLSTHLHQAPSYWLVDSLPGCGIPADQAGMILSEEQTNNKTKERHIHIQGDNWHSGVRWPGRDRHTVQLLSRDLKHGIHPVPSRRAISRAGDSVSRGPAGRHVRETEWGG